MACGAGRSGGLRGCRRNESHPRRGGTGRWGRRGAQPLYVVAGRGGPNLVRGMAVLRDTCEQLGLPYHLFGFDSAMSEVVDFARATSPAPLCA